MVNGAVQFTHLRPHVQCPVHEMALGHVSLGARRFAPLSCLATDAPY